jgi:hypothetical protein
MAEQRMTHYESKIGKRVSEKQLDHEQDRFEDMSEVKLLGRLKRMSIPIKLEAFRQMCIIIENRKLYYACKARLDAVC